MTGIKKFKSKPGNVDVVHWKGYNVETWRLVQELIGTGDSIAGVDEIGSLEIEIKSEPYTRFVTVSVGDYLAKGDDGSFLSIDHSTLYFKFEER